MKAVNIVLWNKLSLIIAVMVLLWSVVNFNSRFVSTSNKIKAQTNTANVLPFKDVKLANSIIKKVNDELSNYQQVNVPDAKKTVGLTGEEQLMQKGELSTLFIKDNRLTLRAIIKNFSNEKHKQFVVLLEVTNIQSNQSRIEKYTNNDKVYGYKLTIEDNKKVTLSREETAQVITLKMYSVKA